MRKTSASCLTEQYDERVGRLSRAESIDCFQLILECDWVNCGSKGLDDVCFVSKIENLRVVPPLLLSGPLPNMSTPTWILHAKQRTS